MTLWKHLCIIINFMSVEYTPISDATGGGDTLADGVPPFVKIHTLYRTQMINDIVECRPRQSIAWYVSFCAPLYKCLVWLIGQGTVQRVHLDEVLLTRCFNAKPAKENTRSRVGPLNINTHCFPKQMTKRGTIPLSTCYAPFLQIASFWKVAEFIQAHASQSG